VAIRAIVFDYFGVIQPDILTATYEHFGGDPEHDASFIADTIYAVNSGAIPSSKPVFAKHLGITTEEWTAALEERREQDPDLLAYIAQLREKGYKTGLLSNMGRGGLQMVWAEGDLKKYFDAAAASGDIGHVKPEPEAYRLIAERLGVAPEECVFTDDQPAYCDGARAIGMHAIHYRRLKQFQQELAQLLRSETA
jgi:putative hydrolase of the HAD superfamily